MHLLKRKRPTSKKMDMTPMIDITFLLIIFFVTVTRISEVNKEQIPLPQVKGEEDKQPPTIIINVNEAGDMIVSGRKLTIGQLKAIVSQEMTNVGNDPARINVRVRVARTGTSRAANDVIEALSGHGVTQVRIGTESPNQ